MSAATPRRSRTLVARLALGLSLLTHFSCAGAVDPVDDQACEALLAGRPAVDALDWFKAPSETPKRLGRLSNEESLAIAYEFELKGARRVVAVGADGDVASGLVIVLPDGPSTRMALFRLYAAATRDAGLRPRADDGQKYLFVAAPGTE